MSGMFATARGVRSGYDQDQVDDFFERARLAYEGRAEYAITGSDVRRAAFDLTRGGYEIAAVDAALDRLERAFAEQHRAEYVAAHGRRAWSDGLAERARTLYGRLARPAGERFAPARTAHQGYRREDVDALCDRLVAYFDRGEPLTSDEVRSATFRGAHGRKAYAEAPVDAFLERAVEVLLGVE